MSQPRVLLVGPHDPEAGDHTIAAAPPLGVWRLEGVLGRLGIRVDVFDPNVAEGDAARAFDRILGLTAWDLIGFSTLGMTLPFDLALAHQARKACPGALLVAGGMEATFAPEAILSRGPFDLLILGEGERPLWEIVTRLRSGAPLEGVPGTAKLGPDGALLRIPNRALDHAELRNAIFAIPYRRMPYPAYWRKLEASSRVFELSPKSREARLSEIRSVRLNTQSYCPVECAPCSSTSLQSAAQGGAGRLSRLSADECLRMIVTIVSAQPEVRTILFEDDVFAFRTDDRILPLCEGILRAKARDEIPEELEFVSTNRIDAMTKERLRAMRWAGFRVLGFGFESFSPRVLDEFGKRRVHRHIAPILGHALNLGITPVLDLIRTSPKSRVADLAETIRQGCRWTMAGCDSK